MTTRLSIPKPDVRVTITTRTVVPVVATPALPACIVGPCYEVLDPQLSVGLAANPDAMITLPAMLRGHSQPLGFTIATNPVVLTLVIDGITVTADFPLTTPGPVYTLAEVLTQIRNAIAAVGAPAVAELVGSGSTQRFLIRTTGDGSGHYITWSVASSTAGNIPIFCGDGAGGLRIPRSGRADGASYYNQNRAVFQTGQYPDPKGIIDSLDIDAATVRVFGSLSSGLVEWLRTSTVERGGSCSLTYLDDGDADMFTNLIVFSVVSRTADSLTNAGAEDVDVDLIVWATTAGAAKYTGLGVWTGGVSGTLFIGINGMQEQAISISGAEASAADVRDKINAVFPTIATGDPIDLDLASLSADQLADTKYLGRDSYITIRGAGAMLVSLFGATSADTVKRGEWHPLQPGAELWVDGAFLGNVIELIAPSSVKLDREVPEMVVTPKKFYFVTKGIPTPSSIIGTATWPAPDLFVSSGTGEAEGTVQIKAQILRDALNSTPLVVPHKDWSGIAVASVGCNALMGYAGLRLDVTPSATKPDLLAYSSVTELTTDMAPIDPTNPLGLGMYYSMINSPGLTVYGMGVDEVSTAEPDGTLEAYIEAAEFLESREVYSIAQLTHSEDVAKMFQLHVDLMSDPEMKGERILWWNPAMPSMERSTLVASGAKANKAAAALTVNTGLADLPARFVAAGITVGTFTPHDTYRVYVQFAAYGSARFCVNSYAGSVLTLIGYSGTEGLFLLASDATFVAMQGATLVDEPFTIGVAGDSLYDPVTGKYDKQAASEALHDLGLEFKDRRVRMVVPDEVIATIGGMEQIIDGYYACCCLAGMKAFNNPSLGFTNMRIGGLGRVQRTEGYFKESQLNLMAGGGAWILIPGQGGGGVVTRMSLTTDTSSTEFRQDSWTSALDYGAKYLRVILRRVIGPTNITQAAMDLVASLCASALQFLKDNEIWNDGTLDSIDQSAVAPDSLDVGISAQIPYNLMYVNVTVTV